MQEEEGGRAALRPRPGPAPPRCSDGQITRSLSGCDGGGTEDIFLCFLSRCTLLSTFVSQSLHSNTSVLEVRLLTTRLLSHRVG